MTDTCVVFLEEGSLVVDELTGEDLFRLLSTHNRAEFVLWALLHPGGRQQIKLQATIRSIAWLEISLRAWLVEVTFHHSLDNGHMLAYGGTVHVVYNVVDKIGRIVCVGPLTGERIMADSQGFAWRGSACMGSVVATEFNVG